jgi:hypothetical protein
MWTDVDKFQETMTELSDRASLLVSLRSKLA